MPSADNPVLRSGSNKLSRLGYRISEWSEMTGTSRVTTWRNVKRGHLKLVYVGSTPVVPRAEAVRLGFINE
jgi:hypothetical protein